MYSTSEVANILHLSRIAIFQKIQSGEIKAQKVGRNYVIPYESLEELLGKTIGTTKKEEIKLHTILFGTGMCRLTKSGNSLAK
jgi:excisionase family DNA binding protein